MSTDQEAQEDELLALASIYDEKEFRRAEAAKEGEIHLCLELPPDFRLLVKGETISGCSNFVLASVGKVTLVTLFNYFNYFINI